jgi:hypothetical protein
VALQGGPPFDAERDRDASQGRAVSADLSKPDRLLRAAAGL